MVDGRFLMRDRDVLTLDERAVTQAAQDVTDAMWVRFQEQEKGVEMPYSDDY